MLRALMVRSTLLAFAWSISVAAYAMADSPRQINVPAGDLVTALESLARQADISVVYQAQQLAGLRTRGVSGNLTPQEAVTQLLKGTKLHLRTDAISGAMLIELPHAKSLSGNSSDLSATGSSEVFRLAQTARGSGVEQASLPTPVQLEEIIVTAQKREERLQDVPIPVTALPADTLVNNGQLMLQDYYTSVPGLSITPALQSTTLLSIRGVTTGTGTNPTVGVMVDDVPYGSSTSLGGGNVVPDIDPGDLSRIEVLRGPQGTLYGASSMGGALKFVTRDPSFAALSGRMEAGVSDVHNGPHVGYNVRASINIPVTDALAFDASAFHRHDPGYIDDVETGERGVNSATANGGRIAALWHPIDTLSVKLSALVQEIKADGRSDSDLLPGLADLQQDTLRGTGWYDRKVQAYSATTTAAFGSASLTSVTGYNINSYSDSFDYSYALGTTVAQPLFHVTGVPLLNDNSTRKFTQELRFSAPLGSRVDWLVGGFYTHEDSKLHETLNAVDAQTLATVAQISSGDFPTRYQEYAAFTDFTFHVIDRLDVQVGGRESHIDVIDELETPGGLVPIILTKAVPRSEAKADAFTYLLTPQYKITPDWMVYARLASGYRAGGPNANGGVAGTPAQYAPDKTENYELGAKGAFFDHKLSVDASLYYIDWKDIQLSLLNATTNLTYKTNGGRAKSQGAELTVEVRPVTGLKLGGWVAFSDAVLTQDLPANPAAYALAGSRLPLSARFSGNLSAEEDFPLTGDLHGVLSGTLSYTGARLSTFQGLSHGAPLPRQGFPAYARADLSAGVSYRIWRLNLFVNNLADRRGILQGGQGYNPPYAFTYIQPRTLGLNLIAAF